MVKLLFIIDTNIGGPGGAEQHLKALVSNLDYSRYSVHVIQLGKVVWKKEGYIEGCTFNHIQTGRLLSIRGILNTIKIIRHIQKYKYDCILSYFESSDIISVISSFFTKTTSRISSRRDTGFRHSLKLKWLYRLLNRKFNVILAASNDIRQGVIESGVKENRVYTIYNGVDLARFNTTNDEKIREELSIGKNEVVLGMVANLSPVKNHKAVIDCLKQYHDIGIKLNLMLVGDGILRKELENYVKKLDLEKYVYFLGRRSDVPYILAGIDIFILSSKTEGLSNALLEAMAARKPIVATKVGGNSEVVKNGITGFLVELNDNKELFNALKKLIDSKSLRNKMGNAGFERVSTKFSLQTMVDSYNHVINMVTNNVNE